MEFRNKSLKYDIKLIDFGSIYNFIIMYSDNSNGIDKDADETLML